MKSLKDLFSTIDLAFILTISACFGYGLSYCYSQGVNSAYKLPMTFIDLDIKGLTVSALVVTVALLGFILSGFIGITAGVSLRRRKFLKTRSLKTKFNRHDNSISRNNIRKLRQKKISFFWMSNILIFMIPPVLTFSVFDYSIERLISSILMSGIAYSFVRIFIFRKYFFPIICIIIMSLLVSYHVGRSSSVNSEDYFIIDQGGNDLYVVLRTYKDNFIIAPVDLKRRVITPKFQNIEMKSEKDKKIEWERMHTGKLKVKKYAD